jgi:RimJ/RimL family protein N-acetyltransferase
MRFRTARLVLRRPHLSDAPAIFARYASDPEVTRFLSWPRHASLDDTFAFIEVSDAQWARWPAGPYLIETPDGTLLGGTGLGFETAERASTGYVLARDAWGQGYATEALGGMVTIAGNLGLARLEAICHAQHRASSRVLEKNGFVCDGLLPEHTVFPNLEPCSACDVLAWTLSLS